MNSKKSEIIEGLISVGKRLYSRDLLSGADGNISYRISDDEILMTESGISKGFLDPTSFATVNIKGEIISGTPSTEKIMHLEIFRYVPSAKCIIHAHPPTAIAWTIARPDLKMLDNRCMSEIILAMGEVPIVPFALPGTQEMADVLIPYLPKQQVFILARHGALAFGRDPQEAMNGIERVEHVAKILLMATQMGGITQLPKSDLDYLWKKRGEIGDRLL